MKRLILILTLLFLCVNSYLRAELSPYSCPTNLSATNILFSSANLSWSNNPNANQWILSYNVSQSTTIINKVLSTNSTQIINLLSGVAYNWKVRMVDNNGDTTLWSNIATFITPFEQTVCSPISQLAINSMDQTGIRVQWNADASQTQWEVVFGDLGSNPEYDGVRIITNNYSYLIPANSLLLDNWYQIAVRNICQGANSGWSYINTRYISNQSYNLPVQQSFENDIANSIFGFISGTLNPWVLGSTYNSTLDGNKSIYISSNGGQTNDYYPYASAISYAYIDVMIPSYASSFYLDFKWKCLGEGDNDALRVYLMSANTELDINQLPVSSNLLTQTYYSNNDAEWQDEHIEVPSEYVGEVRRLVFAWSNNSSLGGVGGAILDDIYVTGRYCKPPTNPTHNNISSSSATLSWTFAEGQQNFNIQYRKTGQTDWTRINAVTSNYVLQNLDDNTIYIYRVQADCGMEQSFFSKTDTFTTLIRCLPPANLHTLSYNNNSAIITWDDNPIVTKWIFEYGVDNGENTIYNIATIYDRFDTLNNLSPNTRYIVRAKAISIQNDTSRYSNLFFFHTLCNPISVYPYNDFADTLKWNNINSFTNFNSCWEKKGDTLISPVFDFSSLGYPLMSFKYLYKDTANAVLTHKLLFTLDNNTFYPISSLSQSDTLINKIIDISNQTSTEPYFRFAIVATHFPYSRANFKLTDFTIKNLCQVSSNLSLLELNPTNIKIDWEGYSNNISWNINLIDLTTNQTTTYSTTIHPYQISNLIPNHDYKIILKSTCSDNNTSTNQTEKTFTTPQGNIICVSPTSLRVENYTIIASNGIMRCSWNADEGQRMWQLNYKDKYSFDWDSIIVQNNPQITLRNMDLEHYYQFKVRAICSSTNRSEWSDVVEFRLSSLDEVSAQSNQIKISPNPTKDIFNIEYSGGDYGQTILINQEGKIIARWDKLPMKINLSVFPSGLYYLKIQTSKTIITKKLILSRN